MKVSISHREELTDFIDGLSHGALRRTRKAISPCDIRYQPWANPRFEQPQLESFSPQNSNSVQSQHPVNAFWDPVQSIRKFGALPLFSFAQEPVVCPQCGHVDIISHGPAERKVLGDRNLRWKCKRCGITFRWGVARGLKYPFSLWGVILSSFIEGDDLQRINDLMKVEAEGIDINVETISSDAVYSIVQRACEILVPFRKFAVRNLAEEEVKLKTVEIDFTPYPLYKTESKSRQLNLRNRRVNFHDLSENQKIRLRIGKPVRAFITGVYDVENRYPPSLITGLGFNYRYSLKCLAQMIETVGDKPQVVKCDGFSGHAKAVKMLLPDVELFSRTKRQYYGIVNNIERFWGELKSECLHPYRFRSLRTLSLAVELKGLEHFFLRPHSQLKGRTPAEFLKIKIPRSILQSNKNEKWLRLLRLAYQMIMIEKALNKRKEIREKAC